MRYQGEWVSTITFAQVKILGIMKTFNQKWVLTVWVKKVHKFLFFGKKYKKMIVTSFVHLQKMNNFPKFGRCGTKIGPATPIWNSKLNWAWQAQFLSHIHEFLQNYLFLKDLQMILVSFFEISDGFWSTKKLPSLLLHVNQDLLALSKYLQLFLSKYIKLFVQSGIALLIYVIWS